MGFVGITICVLSVIVWLYIGLRPFGELLYYYIEEKIYQKKYDAALKQIEDYNKMNPKAPFPIPHRRKWGPSPYQTKPHHL